jgi:hypothetical protein
MGSHRTGRSLPSVADTPMKIAAPNLGVLVSTLG